MPKKTATRSPAPEREQRRQQILAAATQLFVERGMENVTFGDIATSAGLSRPLVYFYFPDLQSLFVAATHAASTELHRRFRLAVEPALSGLDQVMAVGHAYVRFAMEEPALFLLVANHESKQTAELQAHPLQQENMREFAGIMDLMSAALHKGVRDGTVRADLGDLGKVALCLWGLTHGLLQLHVTKQASIEQRLGTGFADLPDFGLGLIRLMLQAQKGC
jgi:AcrR family transcriptional regulator